MASSQVIVRGKWTKVDNSIFVCQKLLFDFFKNSRGINLILNDMMAYWSNMKLKKNKM